ncbi:hypothetical protein [Chromobacterium sp. Beijing]|uniref:hypothetical protein n=1 Tax=Chromobacterium sp. Beijing TaxID=2735795 RepID=UPI001F454E6D|nr:hypothetical protein [Chromobacterium sp. Beijing]UJB31506.1 hypothetical protein HQN78_10800 [Chromobacterium sp. Beijing]
MQCLKGLRAQALESVKNQYVIERLGLSNEQQRKSLMRVQSVLKCEDEATG